MSRRIIAVIAAVVIAIVGVGAVVAYARSADQRALAGQQAVEVYIVKQLVPAGTTAGKAAADGLMAPELVAKKGVPDTALTSIGGGYDQLVATSALQPGEIVLRPAFAARAATQGTLTVPDGMFAVSVALDDPSRVGDFVTVGSHVAVYDTFNVQSADTKDITPQGTKLVDAPDDTRATRLVLPDVEVLAIGATTTAQTAANQQQKSGSQANGNNASVLVTLAVTQAQAEALIHVERTGLMTLALIGPNAKALPGTGIDDRRLFRGAK